MVGSNLQEMPTVRVMYKAKPEFEFDAVSIESDGKEPAFGKTYCLCSHKFVGCTDYIEEIQGQGNMSLTVARYQIQLYAEKERNIIGNERLVRWI